MKTALLVTAVLALLLPCSAWADQITLYPNPPDLYDLNHYYYYTWGLSTNLDVSQVVITGAVLRFDDIRNWDSRDNVLYVHLLDSARDGVRAYYDGQRGGDNFAGQGIELVTYVDLPPTPQDLEHVFGPSQVSALNDYVQHGADVALGLDPDCHFYNEGVSWELTYVPEPATLALLVAGAAAVLVRRRRRR